VNEPLAEARSRFRAALVGASRVLLEQIEDRPPALGLEKVGTRYGGWIVPASLVRSDWVCYCGGVGEDVSFDIGLVERFGCEVYAFDPTPRAIEYARVHAEKQPKFHFQDVGLWSSDESLRFYSPPDPAFVSHSAVNLQGTDSYFEAEGRSLPTIMSEYGHANVDLLKIDIEGAEHTVIASMLSAGIRPIVVCVEIDQPVGPLRLWRTVLRILRSGYKLVAEDRWNLTFVLTDALANVPAREATPHVSATPTNPKATAAELADEATMGPARSEAGHSKRDRKHGRAMLKALQSRGLDPSDEVIDVGCGSLRAGYWLIHFLDPGKYHGIEPAAQELEVARSRVLEPGLEDEKRPAFSSDGAWDLSVFGVRPRFVLARGIWTQAQGGDITALLDSFAEVTDEGLLLASYFPLAKNPSLRRRSRTALRDIRRSVRGLARRADVPAKRRPPEGAEGPRAKPIRQPWFGQRTPTVALDRGWIELECERRGLEVHESSVDSFGDQIWLEIRHGGGKTQRNN
jgi:FkbM family methyltransferase